MSKTLTLGYMPDGTGAAFPFNAVFQESKNVVQRGMDGIDALVLWGGGLQLLARSVGLGGPAKACGSEAKRRPSRRRSMTPVVRCNHIGLGSW